MPLILIGMRSPGKMRSISRNAWAFRSIGCDNPIQIAQNKNLPLRPAYVRRSAMTGFLYKLFALSVFQMTLSQIQWGVGRQRRLAVKLYSAVGELLLGSVQNTSC